jgi:hypothetical protein
MIHTQNYDWASFFVNYNFGFRRIDDDSLSSFGVIFCNKHQNNFVYHILELAILFMNQNNNKAYFGNSYLFFLSKPVNSQNIAHFIYFDNNSLNFRNIELACSLVFSDCYCYYCLLICLVFIFIMVSGNLFFINILILLSFLSSKYPQQQFRLTCFLIKINDSYVYCCKLYFFF